MSTESRNLFAAAAAHILGFKTNVDLTGDPARVKVVQEVIVASKTLYENLENADSIQNLAPLIEEKQQKARAFHEVFGIPWIL